MSDSKYEQGPWSLDDLFSSFDAPEVSEAIQRVEDLVTAIEASRSSLSAEIEAGLFLRVLSDYESLNVADVAVTFANGRFVMLNMLG